MTSSRGMIQSEQSVQGIRVNRDAPFHAHIYYSAEERPKAEALRDAYRGESEILFVGSMTGRRAVGPHPIPQFEVHSRERARAVLAAIKASGLRALVHPLTDDDLADHTRLAQWIGEPIALDVSVLDPPGVNRGVRPFREVGLLNSLDDASARRQTRAMRGRTHLLAAILLCAGTAAAAADEQPICADAAGQVDAGLHRARRTLAGRDGARRLVIAEGRQRTRHVAGDSVRRRSSMA